MEIGILLLFASNYTITTQILCVYIVFICGYILPPKKEISASLRLFSALQ